MILDRLDQSARYANLASGLKTAFDFLHSTALAELASGRHEIDGTRVFAVVSRYTTQAPETCEPEAHRKYLDVQCVARGRERIYWTPRAEVGAVSRPYDSERDIEFFVRTAGAQPCELSPGLFTIFFPEDVHQPNCVADEPCEVLKIVVKVAV